MNPTDSAIQRARSTPLVLELGLVIAVGMIGYFLGRLGIDHENRSPVQSPMPSTTEPEWAKDLRTDVLALKEQLRVAPQNVDKRERAMPPTGGDAEQRELLSRLGLQIDRLMAASNRPSASPAILRTGLPEKLAEDSNQFVWNGQGGFTEVDRYDAWITAKSEQLIASHRLWTLDEVLAAYGPSTSISSSNGRIFQIDYPYRRLDERSSLGIHFQFASDHVTHAWVEEMSTPP